MGAILPQVRHTCRLQYVSKKTKSLHDTLKQKEGEGSKEFKASEGWFDHFRKRFSFKNVKTTGEAASAGQEILDAIRKSLRRKNI